jgi:hypothetical protein
MIKLSRTVRFSSKEAKEIEQFLRDNPFLDFSTLARLALAEFIRDPKIKINPLYPHKNIKAARSERMEQ